MQTIRLCTFSVFSSTIEPGVVVEADAEFLAGGPAIGEQPRPERGSTQARATTLAPSAGVRESSTSI